MENKRDLKSEVKECLKEEDVVGAIMDLVNDAEKEGYERGLKDALPLHVKMSDELGYKKYKQALKDLEKEGEDK